MFLIICHKMTIWYDGFILINQPFLMLIKNKVMKWLRS
ncbi:hypothetical protein AO385_0247 [Moraxella catarrhalis]|uniref:Uncharacterized protein n=1 Tax=Moraxella catarrhalis TaxID=480 RepID=A0A198UN37_MORCA|nr:hypothetical protein EJK50_0145 [Moraxella catarrhalis]OAU96235.1 hypothetical protein AO383_1687 [Moraxella catarrhalis]OAU97766.1 hypothetical protein AO384_0452 [Moraxella catarrhalis]OAV03984.1 hypothetical protein AO385_0247 [Moraxella catarrhalis]